MTKGKELIRNTGILFIGKISTQFVSFLLLPLYTARLATQEYGTLDLYTTIASLLMPFLTLQLEQAVFRFLLTAEEDEKSVLSSTAIFLFLSSLFLIAIFIPISQLVTIQFKGQVLMYYITMLFSTVSQQLPRGYGRYSLYTLVAFLSSTISIIFSVLFICGFNQGIEGILTARIISGIFCVIFVLIKSNLWEKFRLRYFSKKCLKSMLTYSTPLVFNQLASWVVNSSDRFIIIAILGISTNGIYAIANKFFSLITTTLNIYNLAWTESVTKTLHDSDRNTYYNKVFSLTTSFFLMAAAGVSSGIGIFFKYFINANYDAAYYQIPILVYAAMFSGLSANVGSIYIAYKKTKEISYTTILTAVINVIIHLGLIGFLKLYAASISTLFSFFAMFLYRIYRLRNIEKLHFDVKVLVPQIPFGIFALVTYYMRNIVLQLIAFALLVTYAVYFIFNKETFQYQFKLILGRFKK